MLTEEQWFTNRDLYCMVQELKTDISTLKMELAETTTLIRDYNGLRQKITDCEKTLFEAAGKAAGGKDMWGYIVGALGVIMALISFTVK